MNYIKHLTGFFDKVILGNSLNPTHISLYIALFQCWNCNRFRNPISINRDEIMRISKISSKVTYHKCLKNLHALGYIKYEPSFNPFRGSHVILFNFSEPQTIGSDTEASTSNFKPLIETAPEQVLPQDLLKVETGTAQVLVPSINNRNHTNKKNNTNENEPKKKESNRKEVLEKKQNGEPELEKISPSKKTNPTLETIQSYFEENNFPVLEAQKFFNYFSSIGWLVGGKIPMLNWQASAQNWMLNRVNFPHQFNTTPTNRPKQLNTTTNKDYTEPL